MGFDVVRWVTEHGERRRRAAEIAGISMGFDLLRGRQSRLRIGDSDEDRCWAWL